MSDATEHVQCLLDRATFQVFQKKDVLAIAISDYL